MRGKFQLFIIFSVKKGRIGTCIVLAPKNDIDVGELKEADLIFGKFDTQDDFILINHILLLGKYYIYS